MHTVLGATGHVGSIVVQELLERKQSVLAVVHSEKKASEVKSWGAEVATLDIKDVLAIAKSLQRSESAFILMPPGNVKKDSVSEENESVSAIVDAVAKSGIRRVLVESTLGSQAGEGLGDLSSLHALEEGLKDLGIQVQITRAAYYMSNWDVQLVSAKKGTIQSFFPEDFKLPMVAPEDLGRFNAQKLAEPFSKSFEVYNFSGPRDYSANDVAKAFSQALRTPVQVEVIPQEKWIESFQALGFSEKSAASYSKMTKIAMNRDYSVEGTHVRGPTSLDDYISNIVKKS
jgi:uncharacterized protein YbjT (DUF2867 family)